MRGFVLVCGLALLVALAGWSTQSETTSPPTTRTETPTATTALPTSMKISKPTPKQLDDTVVTLTNRDSTAWEVDVTFVVEPFDRTRVTYPSGMTRTYTSVSTLPSPTEAV